MAGVRTSSFLTAMLLGVTVAFWAMSSVHVVAQRRGQPSQEEDRKPILIPTVEKSRKNPVESNLRSIENGCSLFSSQCTMCHGSRGNGKGELAGKLGLRVSDLTDPRRQEERTDGELFYVIDTGHWHMPGAGSRLHHHSKWDLVNYIRTLARPRRVEKQP